MSTFTEALKEEALKGESNLTMTDNGAYNYKSIGSHLVEFDAKTTEFRNKSKDEIQKQFALAYLDDPVKATVLAFRTLDILNGKGERRTFDACMEWLSNNHPIVANEVMSFIPEFGRWDRLTNLVKVDNSEVSFHAVDVTARKLFDDICICAKKDKAFFESLPTHIQKNILTSKKELDNSPSLLAKWLPSLQTKKEQDKIINKKVMHALDLREKDYRKILSHIRGELNILEKNLASKNYDAINMEHLTSKQQLRYAECFDRVLTEQRQAYIEAVLRGEAKMNTKTLTPHEIVSTYLGKKRYYWFGDFENIKERADLEAIWKMLPDKVSGNNNTLVIRDGSASMMDPISNENKASMLDVASALTIYTSERLSGEFKDKFITFSSKPKFVDLSNQKTLKDKIQRMYMEDDCTNTNLRKTFDMILSAAENAHLSQEDMPKNLLILSDMQFDQAMCYSFSDEEEKEALFTTIRKEWKEAGYELPTLVFWQLNAEKTQFPEIDNKNGIIYISGYSTNDLEMVMSGAYENVQEMEIVDEKTGEVSIVKERVILTPEEQLEKNLSKECYAELTKVAEKAIKMERPNYEIISEPIKKKNINKGYEH